MYLSVSESQSRCAWLDALYSLSLMRMWLDVGFSVDLHRPPPRRDDDDDDDDDDDMMIV